MLFREIEYFLERRHAFPGKRTGSAVPKPRAGIKSAHLLERHQMHLAFAARRTIQREVVDGYDPRIPSDLQIGFNEARAQFHGAAKRRHRIFRRVPGSAAMRDRPDSLCSHFKFVLGRLQMTRLLATSYQTRPVRLEMFDEPCAQVAFCANVASK